MLLVFSLIFALSPVNAAEKQKIEKPSEEEALQAFQAVAEDMPAELFKGATMKLGTCVPAVNAKHKGQIACTVAFIFGAGSSETQLDFYRDAKTGKWIAQASESQDLLPFPDPKLR